MCTRPARPLAAAWWALAAVLSLGANAPATVTLPAGDDLLVITDPNLGTTYVSPWMDDWPRPDVLIYPMVAATKTGARTVILSSACDTDYIEDNHALLAREVLPAFR